MSIIATVMTVLVGTTVLVALGYILFGLFESIYGLEEEAREEIHLHAHHTGNLAPHH